jgi:hypothetical protein
MVKYEVDTVCVALDAKQYNIDVTAPCEHAGNVGRGCFNFMTTGNRICPFLVIEKAKEM